MKSTSCFSFLFIAFFMISCEDKRMVQKIEFQHPYLFNSEIGEKAKVLGKYQMVATHYSLKGNHKKALEQWNLAFEPRIKNYAAGEIDSIKSKYTPVSAIDYIIERSKSNQVIIINEAHHNASHRAFVLSLLKKLYRNGYTNLGVEALANKPETGSLLNNRNYPVQKTGYYTKEPQFGNLIRTALRIGYHVFPYEYRADKLDDKKFPPGANPREIIQARNIKAVIEKNPNGKFLIYCGYDHALEGPNERWGKAMAGRLREYTGIDPLTINQVQFSQESDPKFNHPLLKVFNLQEPSILLDRENNPLGYEEGKGWSDLAIFQPKTTYIKGRPSWLLNNRTKLVKIDLTAMKISFPVMVLAYKNGENIQKAVPVDIIEVENRNDYSFLALEDGDYAIVITDIEGNALKFEKTVE